MKSLNILLIAIFSFVLTSCAQNSSKKEGESADTKVVQKQAIVELISATDLNVKMGDNIQLIDVRTPKEFAEGYLKGAKLINFFDKDFLDQMSKLDKNKELYIYCRSGNRSGQATKKLKTMGFTKIYDLKGGIKSWKRDNLEIIK
jgi:rhodanese-related sulfurtransferase